MRRGKVMTDKQLTTEDIQRVIQDIQHFQGGTLTLWVIKHQQGLLEEAGQVLLGIEKHLGGEIKSLSHEYNIDDGLLTKDAIELKIFLNRFGCLLDKLKPILGGDDNGSK